MPFMKRDNNMEDEPKTICAAIDMGCLECPWLGSNGGTSSCRWCADKRKPGREKLTTFYYICKRLAHDRVVGFICMRTRKRVLPQDCQRCKEREMRPVIMRHIAPKKSEEKHGEEKKKE